MVRFRTWGCTRKEREDQNGLPPGYLSAVKASLWELDTERGQCFLIGLERSQWWGQGSILHSEDLRQGSAEMRACKVSWGAQAKSWSAGPWTYLRWGSQHHFKSRDLGQEGRALAAWGRKWAPGEHTGVIINPRSPGMPVGMCLTWGSRRRWLSLKAEHLLVQSDQRLCLCNTLCFLQKSRQTQERKRFSHLINGSYQPTYQMKNKNRHTEEPLVGFRGIAVDMFWIVFILRILQEKLPTLRVTRFPSD